MAIQTKEFTLGSTQYGSASNGYLLKLTLTEESVNVAQNTSCVRYCLQLLAGGSNRFDWEITCRLVLDGAQVGQVTKEGLLDYHEVWTLLSGTVTLPHREDGTLELPCLAQLEPYNGGNRYTPPKMELSDTMTLTPIDRESTLMAGAAMIGSVCHVTVDRKNPAFTHTLHYAFGQLDGYLAADGSTHDQPVRLDTTAVAFAIPEAFYGQIPDSPSGSCTLTLRTYFNDMPIGKAQSCAVTLTADPALCAPTLQVQVADCNEKTLELTGDSNILVRYRSHAACAVTAEAKHGAQLQSVTVNGQPAAELLPHVATERLLFVATDSRGYSTACLPEGLGLLPYIPLSCCSSVKRTHPTSGEATVLLEGNWFGDSFGREENLLTLELAVNDGEYGPVTEDAYVTRTVTGDSYRLCVGLAGLDYEQTHTVRIRLADKLDTVEQTLTLGRGVPVFDWGAEDFAFHVPVTAPSVNDRGVCTNADSALEPGCYRLTDQTVGEGMLLVWTAGNGVCQLAVSRDGSIRKWRLLWDGIAGNWNQ